MKTGSDPISWFLPAMGTTEKESIIDVIDSNFINDGDVTRAFEARVAALVGVRHCVGVTSGTAAISLALMGLGIGPGDEVIVPDLTFIATANAVTMTGASVKLVDVEPRRFAIDPERVAEAIGPKTRAIVPVDVNGRGADYEALAELCAEHGLLMVCDAAEALGSHWNDRPLGGYGDAGCFSFSPNKTVTTGQGGMVATNSDVLYDRLQELKDQGRPQRGTGGNDMHPTLGFNFKLTNLQAAIGLAQFDRLEERLAQARARDRWYWEGLHNCPGVNVDGLRPADDGEIRQWSDALFENRDAVEAALTAANIGCRPFWYPLHTQKPYANAFEAKMDFSIDISARGLWLPSAFDLTREQAGRVCDVITQTLKGCRS
jgi:perosamine synthetase